MKSKLPSKSPAHAPKATVGIPTPVSETTASVYAPSVPISLYREVVGELQTAKSSVAFLHTQNQQLLEQNQKLRVEIERVVQSALHLRQLADHHPFSAGSEAEKEIDLELHLDVPASKPAPPRPTVKSGGVERLFTEQEAQPRRTPQSETSTELNGGWLILVICLIVFSAFGVGFFVVRPFLPSR
jgi:hypothetical protein